MVTTTSGLSRLTGLSLRGGEGGFAVRHKRGSGRGVVLCRLPQPGQNRTGMLSKLGQGFNAAGIVSVLRLLRREPEVALPHFAVPDITSIDWHALRLSGFQGVVLDKDNTITAPYVQTIWPAVASSLHDCKEAFDGRVALLSNSAGLYQYDPDGAEAEALEKTLKIPVLRHGSKKPSGPPDELEKHFGCDASLLVMVGDRYFTDIVYGNRNGLLTFITKPLTFEGEPLVVRQVRALEKYLVRRWRDKGVMPVEHKLMSCGHQFIKDPSGNSNSNVCRGVIISGTGHCWKREIDV